MKTTNGAVLTVFLLSTIGCGGGAETPDLVQVSGTATHDGKPVPNLRLVFQPTGGGRASTAQTDADGQFTLKYTQDTSGALPGQHAVSVSYTPDDPDEFARSGNPGYVPPAPYGTIVAKYQDPAKSPLKVTIEEDQSDLELKLD